MGIPRYVPILGKLKSRVVCGVSGLLQIMAADATAIDVFVPFDVNGIHKYLNSLGSFSNLF